MSSWLKRLCSHLQVHVDRLAVRVSVFAAVRTWERVRPDGSCARVHLHEGAVFEHLHGVLGPLACCRGQTVGIGCSLALERAVHP